MELLEAETGDLLRVEADERVAKTWAESAASRRHGFGPSADLQD